MRKKRLILERKKERFNTYVVEQEEGNILAFVVVDRKYMKEEIYSLMMMYRKYEVNE